MPVLLNRSVRGGRVSGSLKWGTRLCPGLSDGFRKISPECPRGPGVQVPGVQVSEMGDTPVGYSSDGFREGSPECPQVLSGGLREASPECPRVS